MKILSGQALPWPGFRTELTHHQPLSLDRPHRLCEVSFVTPVESTGNPMLNQPPSGRWPVRAGFTLIELLVVIAIIATMASLLLPVLARGKQKAQGIQCMNNHRQLTLAWLAYALENRDWFLYASPGWPNGAQATSWMGGYLDFSPTNDSNWDVTRDIQPSPLWPYCGKCAGIFKCPADRST